MSILFDKKPDYRFYTMAQLYDVYSNIDKDAYPEQYQELLKEITARKNGGKRLVKLKPRKDDEKPKKEATNKQKLQSSVVVLILTAACCYFGVIPGKNGGITLEENPILFVSLIVFSVSLMVIQLFTLKLKRTLNKPSKKDVENDASS